MNMEIKIVNPTMEAERSVTPMPAADLSECWRSSILPVAGQLGMKAVA